MVGISERDNPEAILRSKKDVRGDPRRSSGVLDELTARIMSDIGQRGQLSLTSWPKTDDLSHPAPYTTVEVSAVEALIILFPVVMALSCAGEIIVAFVLGLTPPFKYILFQRACLRRELNTMHSK